jgi:hypothetical protein
LGAGPIRWNSIKGSFINNLGHNMGLFPVLVSCQGPMLELYLTASPDHFTQNSAHYAAMFYFRCIYAINRVFPRARGKNLHRS